MRYLFIPLLLFLLLVVLYEGMFGYTERKMFKGLNNGSERFAEDLKVYFFKGDVLNWIFKGKKADFSNPSLIRVYKFFARRVGRYLILQSDKADINRIRRKAYLSGNVILRFKKGGNLVEVETDFATLDFAKELVYGSGKVVVKESGKTLIGRGFRYNMKSGSFIILRDVETLIGTP